MFQEENYTNIQYYLELVGMCDQIETRAYYLKLLNSEINKLYQDYLYYKDHYIHSRSTILNNSISQKVFSKEELANYNGINGKPAYVAVNGIVYDVSLEPTWGGGTHFKLYSGKDLSQQFQSCHKVEVLQKLPKIGILKNPEEGDE